MRVANLKMYPSVLQDKENAPKELLKKSKF